MFRSFRNEKCKTIPIMPHSTRHSSPAFPPCTPCVTAEETLYRFSYTNYLLLLFINQFEAIPTAFRHFFFLHFCLFCFARWIDCSPLPLTHNAVFALPFFFWFKYIHFTRNARLENSPFARHMDFIATKHDIDKTLSWNPWLVLLCRSSEFAVWPFAFQLTCTCVLIYMQGIPIFELFHRM